jgi:hypothetical protein
MGKNPGASLADELGGGIAVVEALDPEIFAVPTVFTDGDAQIFGTELEGMLRVRGLKVARLVENVVGGRADAVKRLGSALTLTSVIAWRRYRLLEDSPTIAAAVCSKPIIVRQILFRLNEVARKLGLECFPRHASAGKTARTLEALWRQPEYRQELTEAHQGHKHSRETRKRMRHAHLGQKRTAE